MTVTVGSARAARRGRTVVEVDLDQVDANLDLSEGDRVSVEGIWEEDPFEGLELETSSVVKLERDRTKSGQG